MSSHTSSVIVSALLFVTRLFRSKRKTRRLSENPTVELSVSVSDENAEAYVGGKRVTLDKPVVYYKSCYYFLDNVYAREDSLPYIYRERRYLRGRPTRSLNDIRSTSYLVESCPWRCHQSHLWGYNEAAASILG